MIFLTAGTDDATNERVKKVHPYGFVAKPFNERDIYSAIDIAVSNYQAMKKALDIQSFNPKMMMHSNEAIIVTDTAGSILLVNPSAEELFGIDRNTATTCRMDSLVPLQNEATNQPLVGVVPQAIQENRDLKHTFAISFANRRGKKKYVSIEVKRLRNEFNEIYGAFVVFREGMPLASL